MAGQASWNDLSVAQAAQLEPGAVLERLASTAGGLTSDEASGRLRLVGPNALRGRSANLAITLVRQFRNPLLLLLAFAAALSLAFGENTDALIILVIVALSVGLGAFNEYRSERAIEDLHSRVSHTAIALRDGRPQQVPVATLVPGDVVVLDTGVMVPADIRLLDTRGIESDEAVLTGESLPAEKNVRAIAGPAQGLELTPIAFMGTLVRAGSATGVVVRTGGTTMLGSIAHTLGGRQPVTAFERGLHDFSRLLVQVTALLTISIFILNALLHHPLLESLLFALAIAVGLTPQLLPAIVTISLSTGAQRMARRGVVIKRLVSIEDFGNIEVLFTDKTGTLTEGTIEFSAALDAAGKPSLDVLRLGMLCNSALAGDQQALGGNPLDRALLDGAQRASCSVDGSRVLAQTPFDYDRRRMSSLVERPNGARTIVVKGLPESVFGDCTQVPDALRAALDAQFAAGSRVIAVATRDAAGIDELQPEAERNLTAAGLLVFRDPPKADAALSLQRLRALGIELKIVTGDNERVAQKVCADLGLEVLGTLSGAQLATMSDAQLIAALPQTNIFARVTPDQKSRIIRAQRSLGTDVGFLGDGINDAVALHDADVGISVDTGSDVAKDAADIVLLTKDLGILADGVVEGRRIFANTIKYVLMGTSSNFGNMVSTSGASLLIPFLPMLPSQILLNNLLYDISELTIPTDNVDAELLQRPARWDMRLIRRFMLVFGPISSIFDFTIFGVMLWLFHAGEALFRSGFFVESFVTQTLVIFAIRTRRVPFWRSRPSTALAATTLIACAIGAALPFSPFASFFGFAPLPLGLFAAVMGMILTLYFTLVEVAKSVFYRSALGAIPERAAVRPHHHRFRRIASRYVLRHRHAVHAT